MRNEIIYNQQDLIRLIPDNPYLLLTPGPLSTTKTVKAAMLIDGCTWDDEYNALVQEIRNKLVHLAVRDTSRYTSILMQGSGTFSVESVIGSVIPPSGKLLAAVNGAYGQRIADMAKILKIPFTVSETPETEPIHLVNLEEKLKTDKDITHVSVVHVETTTGIKNPIEEAAEIVKKYQKVLIVDAMSSFGGVPIDMEKMDVDFLISSANKCIQGVPGFGFIIAKRTELEKCKNQARSLSLDLYDQWNTLEVHKGKWRFTSPTHVVHAFHQALLELEEEGGIEKRFLRYQENQKTLSQGMQELGIYPVIQEEFQSPIITTFYSPESGKYNFTQFYSLLKTKGFVIYPGKVTRLDTFRIGSIGAVTPEDMKKLIKAIQESIFW